MSSYFGERPSLSIQKCTLRRLHLDYGGSWHQDGAFLGEQIGAMNVWLSLARCGRDAPGLEVIPRRLPLLPKGGVYDWHISEATVESLRVPTACPEFMPGDVLFFEHYCVHRTWRTPEMTDPRYAIESWFFPPSAYPKTGQGLFI